MFGPSSPQTFKTLVVLVKDQLIELKFNFKLRLLCKQPAKMCWPISKQPSCWQIAVGCHKNIQQEKVTLSLFLITFLFIFFLFIVSVATKNALLQKLHQCTNHIILTNRHLIKVVQAVLCYKFTQYQWCIYQKGDKSLPQDLSITSS